MTAAMTQVCPDGYDESKLVEERWHLRDDEQFDLAAWFLSLFNNHQTAKLIGKDIKPVRCRVI